MTTTERPLSLSERMWDASARVERIIHFEAMLTEPDRDLCEWLLEQMEPQLKEAMKWQEEWGSLYALLDEDREEFVSTLARRLDGWAVQISTPVPSGMERGSVMLSWGYYQSRCFMAGTYDAALEAGITWAESVWEEAHAIAKSNRPADEE